MKKVYFIYASIPENEFNRIKYLISNKYDFRWNNDTMYGLYAWTTSKEKCEEFLDLRDEKIYTVVKKETIHDYEFKKFSKDYSELKLDYHKFYMGKTQGTDLRSLEILTTNNEYHCIICNGGEYMEEFGPKNYVIVDYSIFTDEIIDALDTLGYTTEYDVNCDDEDRADYANYQKSFNLTILGKENLIDFNSEVNILLYLFHYMFYGTNKERK